MRSKPQLKIVFYDPSGRGGICHYTFQLAEALALAGCNVNVITTDNYELAGLPRHFIVTFLYKRSWTKSVLMAFMPKILDKPKQNKTAACYAAGIRKKKQMPLIGEWLRGLRLRALLIREVLHLLWHRPHLIHFQYLADRDGDLFFIKLLKRVGFTIVHTAHDLLPHDVDTLENRQYFKTVYGLADILIVHADNLKKEMIKIFDIRPDKIHVVPHGSNGCFFNGANMSKEAARKRLGIELGKKVILFFGLIKPYKGLEYLLQAFELIKERVQDAMLLIAGRVADEDVAMHQYYSNLLSQFADHNPMKCVTEYIPFDQVGCFFSAADLVVLPHIKPSQSGVLLSAMAAGKPVVVTDAGGLSEVVENERTGFVVPPKDAKALAEASVKIFETPGLLSKMSGEAKMLADTTYDWTTIASKTLEIYRSFDSSISGQSWQAAQS